MPPARAGQTSALRTIRDTVIDVGIVLVLAGTIAAYLGLRHEQNKYDGEARAIASWARQRDVARIAWPSELRQAVPALLDAGVRPVLYSGAPVPAALAVNRTGVVVTEGPPPGDVAVLDRVDEGDLTAALVDLRTAARVPLRPGQTVGEGYARPYVYAPISDSRRIEAATPLVKRLTLAPGDYVLSVEVFAPRGGSELKLSARARGVLLATATSRLDLVVEAPTELAFSVRGADPERVTITMRSVATTSRADGSARVHAWRITREDPA